MAGGVTTLLLQQKFPFIAPGNGRMWRSLLQLGRLEFNRMKSVHVVFGLLGIAFILGYFFSGIVIAIYAGIWLHHEKMYYALGVPARNHDR
jgi:hypothetical protein